MVVPNGKDADAGRVRSVPSIFQAARSISRRGDYEELLDGDGIPQPSLQQNLYHLRLMNRWLGWSAGIWDEVRPLLDCAPGRASLLDVATGSGDVPRAIGRQAARRGIRLTAIGSDINAAILRDAGRRPGMPIALVRHDAAALPFADRSVDLVTMSLAAHHLDPAALVAALKEAWRVSRRAVIVSDVERSLRAYNAARLMTLVLRNPLTAHDAPISVLRAYTPVEFRRMGQHAGLKHVRVRRRFPFRMTLVAQKDPAPWPM